RMKNAECRINEIFGQRPKITYILHLYIMHFALLMFTRHSRVNINLSLFSFPKKMAAEQPFYF
ncbi:MAG: hypothetical protein IJC81_00800, partial [Clostridia bacterium]|nr:hypothetical protein [Clostridia bacterium]